MIGSIIANPKASEYALKAAGLSGQDVRDLSKMGIPIWSVVAVSALVGAVVAIRYLPESWISGVREIGK